jgi:hypothetical protein
MENLNIKTIGLNKIIDINKNFIFKVNNNFKSNDDTIKNKIILNSYKPVIIQFKINTKLINKITVEYEEKKYLLENIPIEGILINTYLDLDNNFEIYLDNIDDCSRINLFDFEILNYNKFKKISWEKIFIINLKRRIDRKIEIINKLNKYCLNNYEFIDAIDGKEKNILNEYDKLKNDTNIVNSGHYGCLLSHIKAITRAKNENLKSVLIIEDDVIFSDDFYSKINSTLVPKYDLLYLGGIIDEIKFFTLGWGKSTEIMGAYAYIIKKNMYDIVLNYLNKKIYCVDIAYIEYLQNRYNIFILDDLIKTNLDSSDTSEKNKILVKMLKRTWIKPKLID